MTAPPAYILAGGKSARFGGDKARAPFRGRPLILRVAEALRPIVAGVTVVADRKDKYADLGLPTIADREPGAGPLEGLLAALRDRRESAGEGWLLLASCDLVQVGAGWLAQLRAASVDGAAAVAFRTDRWQPLFALYHTSIEPVVRQQQDLGESALFRLLDAAGAIAIEFPGGRDGPAQVNTKGELEVYQETEEVE